MSKLGYTLKEVTQAFTISRNSSTVSTCTMLFLSAMMDWARALKASIDSWFGVIPYSPYALQANYTIHCKKLDIKRIT